MRRRQKIGFALNQQAEQAAGRVGPHRAVGRGRGRNQGQVLEPTTKDEVALARLEPREGERRAVRANMDVGRRHDIGRHLLIGGADDFRRTKDIAPVAGAKRQRPGASGGSGDCDRRLRQKLQKQGHRGVEINLEHLLCHRFHLGLDASEQPAGTREPRP